jgi:serine/threonine protein kinase
MSPILDARKSNDFHMATFSSSSSSECVDNEDELAMSVHQQAVGAECRRISVGLDKENDNWIEEDTRRMIISLLRGSDFFATNPSRALPTFQENELVLGQMIGRGEFGMVLEVKDFNIETEQAVVTEDDQETRRTISFAIDRNDDEDPTLLKNIDQRRYMRDNALREGNSQFAIKRVRLDLVGERKGSSAVDLAIEAKFLASINHSNIIKMRATVSQPGCDSFMIVLDRLYNILDKIIERWRDQVKATRGMLGFRVVNKLDHYKAKTDRLVCLFDICRGLNHLHSLKILYRDLKPENIGCDIRGNYKIFDFGLSKELKQNLLRVAPDGYQCTGLTGSRRWMAPEVCLCKLYGLSADVYSFSLLFHHILTLELPFQRYDIKKHMVRVVYGRERPAGKIKTEPKLRNLILRGWDADPHKRPSTKDICDAIQEEIVGRKQDVERNQRRSTVANIIERSLHMKKLSLLSVVGKNDERRDN